MDNSINNKLKSLWAQKIDKIDYDISIGNIKIYLSDEKEKLSVITFMSVSSFL